MKKHERIVVRNKEMILRSGVLMFLDVLIIMISMAGALWIRFDFHFGDVAPEFMESIHDYMLTNIIATDGLALFMFSALHQPVAFCRCRGDEKRDFGRHFFYAHAGGRNEASGTFDSAKLSLFIFASVGVYDNGQQVFLSLFKAVLP